MILYKLPYVDHNWRTQIVQIIELLKKTIGFPNALGNKFSNVSENCCPIKFHFHHNLIETKIEIIFQRTSTVFGCIDIIGKILKTLLKITFPETRLVSLF